ncbi:hypothetical protein SAMN05661080_01110 [Modestobacter sp. DSM 44400]|uniref:hypothetical protein n=1 Tax=Modestobacter sp. DSM 44400 TaxID=1550230 RepID=UPI000894CD37|nr:hypothetical protein [Modestobacter sp. DSM 44400]SDX76278.1 hypothetical protein SAMN05661080_01110 [Modestobacter sp. DSM 44400]
MPEQAVGRRSPAGRAVRPAGALVAVPLGLLWAVLPASPVAAESTAGPVVDAYGAPATQCTITDPRLPELSGLATAGASLLAMNDGGDSAVVYVLDAACAVSEVRSAPVDPFDPEDLAPAADGTIWLADTGDNRQSRTTVAMIGMRPDGGASLTRLTYPDGAHDAEALLLAPDGTPYLVTKEVLGASAVYRPDAPMVDGATLTMSKVAQLGFTLTGTPGGPVGRAGQLLVTGGAVSGDGQRIALRTYTDAYVWPLKGSDIVGALQGAPARVPLPESPQGEAIAFAENGRDLLVSGEGMPAVVTVLPVDGAVAPAASTAPAGPAAAALPDTGRAGVLTAAAIAAAVATILVWSWGRLRRRA